MKRSPALLIALIVILIPLESFSQKEYYNWVFGIDCQLTFDTPGLSPKKVNGAKFEGLEGCATISDKNGNLLFFTNGVDVWNRNYEIMPNGKNIGGHVSSTQSSLIIQKPGDDNIFYIFTTEDISLLFSDKLTFSYSIVDIRLDGGLGDVTEKIKYLNNPSTEKLCAAMHSNGEDVWIFTHDWGTNGFRKYLLGDKLEFIGVQNIGPDHKNKEENVYGHMKFTSDFDKLALVRSDDACIDLFKFNNESGELSDPLTIQTGLEKYLYGVEFSPYGNMLYISAQTPQSDYIIYQLDISDWNAQNITNSLVEIKRGFSDYGVGAIQAGPNGKLYFSLPGNSYLGAINNPNTYGAGCNFDPEAYYADGTVEYGLPNVIPYPIEMTIKLNDVFACAGDTIFLNATISTNNARDIYWEGPGGFTSKGKNVFRADADKSMEGWYYVYATYQTIVYKDSVWVAVSDIDAYIETPDSTVFCEGNSILLGARPSGEGYSYLWNTGETDDEIFIYSAGEYSCTVTDSNGCSSTASVITTNYPRPNSVIAGDTAFCEGKSLILESENAYDGYYWSNGDDEKITEISEPGKYYLIVTNEYGCKDTSSIDITVFPKAEVEILGRERFCFGEKNTLSADRDFVEYSWSTGETTKDIDVTATGYYDLKVVNKNGCVAYDTIHVEMIDPIKLVIKPLSIDYGMIFLDKNDINKITLQNTDDANMNVNAYLLDGVSSFSITSPTFPRNIAPGEIKEIDLSFQPEFILDYADSLIIEVTGECPRRVSIPVLGAGKVGLEVWLPEQIVTIGKSACVPMYAKVMTETEKLIPLSFNSIVSLDAAAMDIVDYKEITGSERILELSGDSVMISGDDTPIGEFCGLVLLGNSDEEAMFIKTFEWNNPHIEMDTADGKLLINDICVFGMRRVSSFEKSRMEISPNPAGEQIKVNIVSEEKGRFVFSLYSMDGKKVYSEEWAGEKGRSLNISASDFRQGLYTAVLLTPWNTLSQQLIIAK